MLLYAGPSKLCLQPPHQQLLHSQGGISHSQRVLAIFAFLKRQRHSLLEGPGIWVDGQSVIKHRKSEGQAGRRLSEVADVCGQSTWPRQHLAICWHPALHGGFWGVSSPHGIPR